MSRHNQQSIALGLIFALFLIPLSLKAETITDPNNLEEGSRSYNYLFSQQAHKALFEVGLYWDKQLGLEQNCESKYDVTPTFLRIHSPIVYPEGATHPTSGIWQYTYQLKRCGSNKTYNAIFMSQDGQIPKVKPYFPGHTLASAKLINDALQSAYAAAGTQFQNKECAKVFITDMEVSKPPHDEINSGRRTENVWNETWSFSGCGETAKVDMRFVPDAKGGTSFEARPQQ
ncbi:MAG: hypothetical protein HUJ29_07505 [Gammaproteobacteria bacterium]|nr:hypothetical protein [Gammaproteobacteria bacterium]